MTYDDWKLDYPPHYDQEPKMSEREWKLPHGLTVDMIVEAVESDDYLGFCLACGGEVSGVEPDAERYTCEHCEEQAVFGAEQLVIMFVA